MLRERPIVVIAGNSQRPLGEKIAATLNLPFELANIGSFADGETRVGVGGEIKNATVILIQSTGPPVNDNLLVLALLADASRAAGVRRVIAVTPYLGYCRQDQRSSRGDPRSAQVVAKLLGAVGVDHLVTIDLHSPPLESAFPMPVTNVPAVDVFRTQLERSSQNLVVVSPDAGGIKRAQQFATALQTRLAVVTKRRIAVDQPVAEEVLGDVHGSACLIVDDMASTGRTMVGAADALLKAGGQSIDAIFTHAVMAPGTMQRLLESPIRRLVTSDSLPEVTPHERLRVEPVGPVVAKVLQEIVER
ncbi:MAG: ribose-phosphate diphosphokinase [Pirellulales bacterium]